MFIMEGLGKDYDIGVAVTHSDFTTAWVGKRISMHDCSGIDIVMVCSADGGGGTADPVPSLQQHTAYTSGTSADLEVIDTIYRKSETLLDNDESWTKTTQTAAAIMTAVAAEAEKENLYVIHVEASALADGYGWISVNMADLSEAAKYGCAIYIKHGLRVKRAPANLGNLLHPGAANA
jgi:hypothetical protein